MKQISADRRQVACILLGAALCGLAWLAGRGDTQLEGGILRRPSYGEEEREEKLVVSGLTGDEVEITVPLAGREYTEEEAECAMDVLADDLPDRMRGENSSLAEVRSPLNFPEQDEATGILLEWLPEDPDLLSADGSFSEKNLAEEGVSTDVLVRLRAGEYSKEYRYTVTLFPPAAGGEEAEIRRFLDFVRAEEQKQRTSENLRLPAEFDGKPLAYGRASDSTFLLFPLLGIGAALVLPVLDRQREEEKKKKRELEMMKDYPEIVSRLVVLTGAGLPVRRAFEQIAAEYEKTAESHAAYEEMIRAVGLMSRGVPEIQAYEEFASRCRCLPYRKLSGLLAQNVRNGSDRLREALETEMDNAFEERKNLARRMGEEASTRLLLPLVMMLLLVMIMVCVPAFLSFLAE
jgi:tight adherence protein C